MWTASWIGTQEGSKACKIRLPVPAEKQLRDLVLPTTGQEMHGLGVCEPLLKGNLSWQKPMGARACVR